MCFCNSLNNSIRIKYSSPAKDIKELSKWKLQIDEQVKTRNAASVNQITKLYNRRITAADSIVTLISKNPFNFTIAEKITVARQQLSGKHPGYW